MNLVMNSSEAMKAQGGVIRVATRLVTIGQDSPWADRLREGSYVELEVSDTGNGMPPEMQAKVFEPFFSTKSPGRGLGLAVIEGTVRGLHGAIRLESEEGKGTTFQIRLPCTETIAATAHGSVSRGEKPGPPL